ncbi:MAG: hypothetical protein IPJ65_41655 [Archangiaceae bacterium]|nr:hypothetical protein [Archangiaceae bacterium]
MPPLTEVARTPTFRLARSGKLVVAVYHGPGTVSDLDALVALQLKVIAELGSQVSMTVITTLREMPKPEVREKVVAVGREHPELGKGALLVLTAKGIGAVLFRTFMAATGLLSHTVSQVTTVRTVAEAVEARRAELGLPSDAAVAALTAEIEAYSVVPDALKAK